MEILISSINPGGIKLANLQATLQHAIDLQIDIQAYAEVNLDTLKSHVRQGLNDQIRKLESTSRSCWSSSLIQNETNYKLGGTGIVSLGNSAGCVNSSGSDPLGCWTYQILDGKGTTNILIISVY